MRLSEVFSGAGLDVKIHSDPEIHKVQIDSRKVGKGDLFIALKGIKDDGTLFIGAAIKNGAVAILTEEKMDALPVESIRIHNLRKQVGPIMNASLGMPSAALLNVAVTGTNGKSTITKLVSSILKSAGHKVISLGTIDYSIDGETLPSHLTTPGPDTFFELLKSGVDKKCTALAMEVSSHALSQDRIRGVTFDRAIFTNLTQDHMDYHVDFEDYYQAKKKLFTEYLRPDGMALLNLDSEFGIRLSRELSCTRFTFSRGAIQADVMLNEERLTLDGTELEVSYRGENFRFTSSLIGNLNLENLLAVIATGFSLGIKSEFIKKGIASVTVLGRNQVFKLPQGAFAVVDYAHSPDALERVLTSLKPLTPGKLVCLFGCGGDRDKAKRPMMGGIAVRHADRVILTSDNPRSEVPEVIIQEILQGTKKTSSVTTLVDRKAAIQFGLDHLKTGDCLLIAGKGHEDYQIIGVHKTHFSDQEEIMHWTIKNGAELKVVGGLSGT